MSQQIFQACHNARHVRMLVQEPGEAMCLLLGRAMQRQGPENDGFRLQPRFLARLLR
jgi:hypothetical protein